MEKNIFKFKQERICRYNGGNSKYYILKFVTDHKNIFQTSGRKYLIFYNGAYACVKEISRFHSEFSVMLWIFDLNAKKYVALLLNDNQRISNKDCLKVMHYVIEQIKDNKEFVNTKDLMKILKEA